jgi:hypothetical protein
METETMPSIAHLIVDQAEITDTDNGSAPQRVLDLVYVSSGKAGI